MNVPKLRFKEFNDEWCKEYAGNLCSIQTGKSNTQDKTDDGIYPFYVRSPIIEKSHKFIFDTEAVLTVGDGVGVGKVFHYINGKFDCHQRVYMMNNFNKITAKYFYYIFSRDFDKRVMKMTAKTSVDSVRYEMIDKMQIFYPTVLEQNKISRTLELLDKKIELQSKKIEDLKLFKLSIKNNIFKSFDKEQRKSIEELLEFEQPTKYIVKSEEYTDNRDDIPVLTANKAFILGYCKEGDFYNKECIIFDDFTLDMKYVNFAFKVKSSAIKILTPKENINIKYIYEYMQFLNLHSEEHKRHYISIVQKIQIPVPIFEIQNKIATQLNCFDSKIELENNKLLKLTELKKGLMQSMFV